MNTAFDQVLQAALSLPAQARAELVDSLIATLPPDELPFENDWLAKIERRSAEIDAGTVTLEPWEEARKRVTDRLKRDD